MEAIKPIVLTDVNTGEKYTLEFDKESVKFAERRGFSIDDVARYPMIKMPEFFYYSLRKHHKSISLEKADKMFEMIQPLPDDFMGRLAELYAEPFKGLTEETDRPKQMTVEM